MSRIVLISISLFLLLACTESSGHRDSVPVSGPESTPKQEPANLAAHANLQNAQPSELCNHLADIRKLPYRDPSDTDPIYEALIAKGEQTYTCLIDKITDTTEMPDPREAPPWQHYVVGDTAVFILVRSIGGKDDLAREQLLIDMLPFKYRDEWETNGIYAYFNYVSDPKNRRELQRWWRKKVETLK